MPIKKYTIDLTNSERDNLKEIVKKGSASALTILHANILLVSDIHANQNLNKEQVAELFNTTHTTVQTVRKTYALKGLDTALYRKRRSTPPVPAKVDGNLEAHIIALCCSKPPKGYARWSVRLLSGKCVELGFVNSISHMTISRTLKKMNLSLT